MLVLSRKLDEKILINNEIEVTVLEIRGNRVRLGIRCSPEIPVHRSEVFQKIQAECAPCEPTCAVIR